MKVLLIQLPQSTSDDYVYMFPLGLGYISAVLEKAGHEVKIIDLQVDRTLFFNIENILKDYEFDFIGLSGMISAYYPLKQIVPILKKNYPNIPVILGGSLVNGIEALLMEKTQLDYVCKGEGEQTIVELLEAVENKEHIGNIKGIYYRDNENNLIFTGERPLIDDLDSIPFPAWHLFDMEKYFYPAVQFVEAKSGSEKVNKMAQMSILSSRGCPARCNFCCRVLGDNVRYRSPENIVQEMKELKKFNIERLTFVDETMTANTKWLRELCEKIVEENINIKWVTSSKITNNIRDESVYDVMSKAGCFLISYGLESGNKEILNSYKKYQDPMMAVKMFQVLGKRNISTLYQIIVGGYGETSESVRDTTKICMTNSFVGTFYYLTPFPGTEIYEKAKLEGKIKDEDAYLTSISTGDWRLNKIPSINLTNLSDKELKTIKEDAENDMRIFYQIRNKIGLLGENLLFPLLMIQHPQQLSGSLDFLLDNIRKNLKDIKYIKEKYPDLLVDINYFISEQPIDYKSVGTLKFKPDEDNEEKTKEIFNYFINKYGTFSEKIIEKVLLMPKQQLLTLIFNNFTQLKKIIHQDMMIINYLKEKLDTKLIPINIDKDKEQKITDVKIKVPRKVSG